MLGESLKSFFNLKDILLKENYIDSDEINKYPELNLEELQTRCLEDAILYNNSCMEKIKKIYSNVKIWMKLIIVRPTSSVDCERSFSHMRLVNNWLRHSMEQKRLTSLIICSIHSETLDELNIDVIIC